MQIPIFDEEFEEDEEKAKKEMREKCEIGGGVCPEDKEDVTTKIYKFIENKKGKPRKKIYQLATSNLVNTCSHGVVTNPVYTVK
ncbi:hypothetical protein AX774_g5938 [Zancudomyces culisetae]|uniref:Uncharacterized protein n=1 Tax=Zancudomyces culisetae TaxID=1213189 RepID=A0A1R1PI35_ZANCU|nr:hypothetical protein AX774_g5938 [Zancudomyces culisetae]|eukprot:OMH80616.1 hypothetical protein AX774_g5938 [Zancudomyces culisetae]